MRQKQTTLTPQQALYLAKRLGVSIADSAEALNVNNNNTAYEFDQKGAQKFAKKETSRLRRFAKYVTLIGAAGVSTYLLSPYINHVWAASVSAYQSLPKDGDMRQKFGSFLASFKSTIIKATPKNTTSEKTVAPNNVAVHRPWLEHGARIVGKGHQMIGQGVRSFVRGTGDALAIGANWSRKAQNIAYGVRVTGNAASQAMSLVDWSEEPGNNTNTQTNKTLDNRIKHMANAYARSGKYPNTSNDPSRFDSYVAAAHYAKTYGWLDTRNAHNQDRSIRDMLLAFAYAEKWKRPETRGHRFMDYVKGIEFARHALAKDTTNAERDATFKRAMHDIETIRSLPNTDPRKKNTMRLLKKFNALVLHG